MSDEEKNIRPDEEMNPEEVDLSALLSGIRRVSSDEDKKSRPEKKEAEKTASHEEKAASHEDKKVPHEERPAAHEEKPVSHEEKAIAHEGKNGSAPRKDQPVRRRPMSAEQRKRIAAKRKKAEILMILTIVMVLALVCVGVFFAIRAVKGGEKKNTEVSTTSVAAALSDTSETETEEDTSTTTTEEETDPTPSTTPEPTPFPVGGPDLSGYCVVIDAGHQGTPNLEQEPLSSSMSGSKDKSAEGYTGVVSGINESQINLDTALLLSEYLKSLGCEVYLTRETEEVDISNKERAEFAVSKDPDLYIRLYCNYANDSKTSGMSILVPSSGKYASEMTVWGENLGKTIENFTGISFRGCQASGNYSGLNWADSIPSFMIRMGYLSNSDDEARLQDEEYQFQICQGVAQFITTMAKH